MNVQTTSSEILGEVYWHVGTEVLETLALREADDSDIIKLGNAVKAARANLLPLLKEAAKLEYLIYAATSALPWVSGLSECSWMRRWLLQRCRAGSAATGSFAIKVPLPAA